MEDAYTAKQIAQALNVTRQAIQQRATSDEWPVQRNGEGKAWRTLYYSLSTLPADIREALARVKASEAASAGREAGLQLKFETDFASQRAQSVRAEGLAMFACMGEKAKSRAEVRAALVQACREYIASVGSGRKAGREVFAHLYNTGQIELGEDIRAALPTVSASSLSNWEHHLSRDGLGRLAGKYGQHRVGTGKIDRDSDVRDFIEAYLGQFPHCTATSIHAGLEVRFPDRLPSLIGVQRWARAWKAQNPRLFQDLLSPDQCRSQYQPATGSRFEGIVRPNQRWEMDSTKGDVMLWDGKKKTRHIIVGCIDLYTRRVKFLVSRSSSSGAVASLLRRCLLDWGQVEQLGTDNGSDFVSNHITRIAMALDIERDVAAPFTPEHKPFIERVFGTFLHGLVEGLRDYIGHNVAQRKAIEDRKAFAARVVGSWTTGKGEAPELMMSPEGLQKFCDEWSDALYAHKPHSGEGMNGKTPWQKAVEWTGTWSRIRPEDERGLDILLAPVAGKDGWRDVTKKGLEVGRKWYTSPHLGGHEGRRVHVLQDEADWGAVHVFLPNEVTGTLEYLCRAICPELTGISRKEEAMARRRVYDRIRAEEKAAIKEKIKAVRPEDVAREIMVHAVEKAAKVSRLPSATIPHETEALRQAGFAARANDAPVPTSSEQQLKNREVARASTMAANVHPLPETRKQRFSRWMAVGVAIEAGQDVSEEDRTWWITYQTTAEYRGEAALRASFAPKASSAAR